MTAKNNKPVPQEIIEAAAVGTVRVASFCIDLWHTGKVVANEVTKQIKEYNEAKTAEDKRVSKPYTPPYKSQQAIGDSNKPKEIEFRGNKFTCIRCGTLVSLGAHTMCLKCQERYTISDGQLMVACSNCKGDGIVKTPIGTDVCRVCDGKRFSAIDSTGQCNSNVSSKADSAEELSKQRKMASRKKREIEAENLFE